MLLITDLFKQKKFPDWFTSHPIFKDITKIRKVFPGIGLPNCEENIRLGADGLAKESALELVADIATHIASRIQTLPKFVASKPDMGDARKIKYARSMALLGAVSALVEKDREAFIKEHNKKLTIKLPSDILIEGDVRPTFREGESLFRVFNKLNESLREGGFAKMQKLENSEAFKAFSTENVPDSKLKIVFSSDGVEGAWDIATMSMRGVRSCQSWGGEYCHCTIGSVIDPFVGIVYLTSGAKYSEHGSKMIRRALVRFVINSKSGKPYFLLDYMYPSADSKVINQFKKFLKAKTGEKFDVEYAPNIDPKLLHKTYMPLTDVRKLLKETSRDGEELHHQDELNSLSSYQDIRITDKSSNKNDKQAELYEKNSAKKTKKFLKDFEKAFSDAIKEIDIAAFSDSLKPAIRKLKGKDKNNFSYNYLLPDFSHSIAKEFIKTVDKKEFTSSDLFLRRIYYSYFINKFKIIDSMKTKLTRSINGKLQLKEKNRIRSEHFISMMGVLLPKLDEVMKANLKELVSKHKPSDILPLP